MRASLALAAAALLTGCAENNRGPKTTNCMMTLAGEGADPWLWCEYVASPTQVKVSENGGPYVETWGLVIHGYRDSAQDDQAVAAVVVFDPGVEPVAGTTYACDPGSDPAALWSASASRGSSATVLTHHMSWHEGWGGNGSLSVTFTSVTSSPTMNAPTHGALDATLVATDGSGKALALHVEF